MKPSVAVSVAVCARFFFPPDAFAVAVSTRLSVIVADIIVLVVTWLSTFDNVRRASSAGITVNISQTLLLSSRWCVSRL